MSATPRTLADIDTPAAVIDLDLVRRNIETMERHLEGTGVHVRPHIKHHKTPGIALMQIEAGAPGVTCAKVGEAEAMVDGGVGDVLIANQVVGPLKIARLCSLARRAAVTVAVDDARNVRELSEAAVANGVTIGIVIEIEVGMNRCGILPGQPAVALAQQIDAAPGLDLVGLMGYEGHAVGIVDRAERVAAAHSSLAAVIETKAACEAAGLEIREVTGGGTNTFDITSAIDGWTELQCGTYVTMDVWFRPHAGHAFEQAMWILSSVVSTPAPGRAILDVGRKSMAFEAAGLPLVEDPPGIELLSLSEEHGSLALHEGAPDLQPGDRLKVTPWHGCTTFNLHDTLYVIQDDDVVDIWPISARGKFT